MDKELVGVHSILKDFEENDFFTTDETGKRSKLLESMRDCGSLPELIDDMNSQYELLFSKYQEDANRGGYSAFLYSWCRWIKSLICSDSGVDPVIVYDHDYESELFNVLQWVGWALIDLKAKGKRIDDLQTNDPQLDVTFKAKRPYELEICQIQAKKNKLRHLKTDRLYTMNRLAGGVIGEIWKVNKQGMQIMAKIQKGKKPLTEKQRDQCHILYKIALSIRNPKLLIEDLPDVINMINKGGLFIGHCTLIPFVSKITKLVVDEYKYWQESPSPGVVIKETVKCVKQDETLKPEFHAIVSKIPEIIQNRFKVKELEDFRVLFQRKLVHAKLADSVRATTRRRNERKGKRSGGGQNLRCVLYGLKTKSKKQTVQQKKTVIKKNGDKSQANKTVIKKKVKKSQTNKTNVPTSRDTSLEKQMIPSKDIICSNAEVISPSRPLASTSRYSNKSLTKINGETSVQSRSGRNIRKNQSKDFFYNLSSKFI